MHAGSVTASLPVSSSWEPHGYQHQMVSMYLCQTLSHVCFLRFWRLNPCSVSGMLLTGIADAVFVSMANTGQFLWYSAITSPQMLLKGIRSGTYILCLTCRKLFCSSLVERSVQFIGWQKCAVHWLTEVCSSLVCRSVSDHSADTASVWLPWTHSPHSGLE